MLKAFMWSSAFVKFIMPQAQFGHFYHTFYNNKMLQIAVVASIK